MLRVRSPPRSPRSGVQPQPQPTNQLPMDRRRQYPPHPRLIATAHSPVPQGHGADPLNLSNPWASAAQRSPRDARAASPLSHAGSRPAIAPGAVVRSPSPTHRGVVNDGALKFTPVPIGSPLLTPRTGRASASPVPNASYRGETDQNKAEDGGAEDRNAQGRSWAFRATAGSPSRAGSDLQSDLFSRGRQPSPGPSIPQWGPPTAAAGWVPPGRGASPMRSQPNAAPRYLPPRAMSPLGAPQVPTMMMPPGRGALPRSASPGPAAPGFGLDWSQAPPSSPRIGAYGRPVGVVRSASPGAVAKPAGFAWQPVAA
eukprot:gnl/TRDRNA2_/TRDRNA2_175689_c0_seq1.p1 gnl/TRDRNA2_/TRDRNA2_175689_c0~~gnl/TRDRNA2_/TRDRNA2_175689_c0_seq1.p1  ORF type:complete len:313 (-),score=27.31 gnl/TRDRNA2_/TRDRNA2_175689_c0_seq1:116-1054(-)